MSKKVSLKVWRGSSASGRGLAFWRWWMHSAVTFPTTAQAQSPSAGRYRNKAADAWFMPCGAGGTESPGLNVQENKMQTNFSIMKHKLFLFTFLAITTLTVGCNREPTASEQIEKLKHDTKAVAQDLKNYEFAQKTEFSAAMKYQLAEINKDLNEIEAKIAKSSGTVKDQVKPKLQALRLQETELNKQLNEIENATESTWDAVKSGTVSAYNSFKEGLNQSRQWVSDKIAP